MGLFALQNAAIAKEYVHRFELTNSCYVVVTTIYEYSNKTVTKQYSCAEYDAMQAAVYDAYQRKLEQENQARQQAKRDKEVQTIRENQLKLEPEIERSGMDAFLIEIAKAEVVNKYYPDKVVKALDKVSTKYSTVKDYYSLISRVSQSNYYGESITFQNLAYALLRVMDLGYKDQKMEPWHFKLMNDRCGKKVTVFWSSIHDKGAGISFGLTTTSINDFLPNNVVEGLTIPDSYGCAN